jgi:ketose-bisphosphate aldolase
MLARNDILKIADIEGFAIPAFNFSDIWDMQAIIEAAEEEEAVVMLAANPLVMDVFGIKQCAVLSHAYAETSKVPILPHQDHSFEIENCLSALAAGYTSVMMDASKFALEENIRIVRSIVESAHQINAVVEAEVGLIKGTGIEGEYKGTGMDFLANPEDCVRLVEESGCDSLAIGIGNAHGFYKGKPELHFYRLNEINEAVDVPLVLHGGTGIPAEDIQKAISGGINKVNVGTIIHCTYMNALKTELNRLPENPYTHDVMAPVIEEIKIVVKEWIRVCMSNGRAKDFV